MGKCREKITNKRGFTLGETLVATVIMLMVAAIMVAGIPVAKSAYDKVIVQTSAEMLMSTAVYSLRNEMSVASDIKIDGTTITYISGTYSSRSKIFVVDADGIMYQRYSTADMSSLSDEEKENATQRLVSKSASGGLCIKYSGANYSKAKKTIKFTGLEVYKGNRTYLTRDALSISIL